MKRILVTYATMAGSTAEVARAVAQEIGAQGLQVDLLPLSDVQGLDRYSGVVVGGPMIMGWHREASRFLRRNRDAWQKTPLAVFVTAMSLTETGERSVDGLPVTVDEGLPKAPKVAGRLNFRERYARLGNYLRPILKAARPASVAIFGGRLEYGRLPWWAVLFAMFIIQAPAGDLRNWEAIGAWGAELPAMLGLEARVEQAAAA